MKLLYLLRVAIALLAVVVPLQAEPYPYKPIRLIVPFPAGGAADLSARTVTQALSQVLGQPLVVDNRGGADGAIAGRAVQIAEPDGYTLLFATTTGMNAVPILRKEPPYDPITAFTPISLVGKFGFFLFVHESLPAKSVPEFISYIRANPGKVNYATGNGTSILATAQLARAEKLNMQHIPYKGDAPATADLIAGRVQVMIGTPGSAMPQVEEGKLRVLTIAVAAQPACAGCADSRRGRPEWAHHHAMGWLIRPGEASQGSRRSRRRRDEGGFRAPGRARNARQDCVRTTKLDAGGDGDASQGPARCLEAHGAGGRD